MRLIHSERLKQLSNLVLPWTVNAKLRDDAPQEIKDKFEEFCKLWDEEYEKACI